jgi:hypothetical protein
MSDKNKKGGNQRKKKREKYSSTPDTYIYNIQFPTQIIPQHQIWSIAVSN